MSWQARWRRNRLPAGFAERLAHEERVLATAGDVIATSHGLWLPENSGHRLVGWHMISKAVWKDGVLSVIEAEQTGEVTGVVLLRDLAARRLPLVQPGKLPEVVRGRVTASVRSSHRRELPGGGAWVVQRKVAGVGGVTLQVRADPNTDAAAVRKLARQVGEGVRRLRGE